MLESIWTDHVTLPSFPALEGDCRTDTLIIGGGLAGLLCAYMLTKAGKDCLLIEADRLCQGVTRNTTAKVTSQHGLIYARLLRHAGPEAARLYWQVHEDALTEYRQLCQDIPCHYEEKDAYLYATADSPALRAEWNALQSLRIPAQWVDRLPLPFPVTGAIRFAHQGQLHPLQLAAGLARGLRIHEHTRAIEVRQGEAVTNRGRIRAGQIIVATHFPIFNKHGGYFVKMHQERSYVLALSPGMDVQGMYLDASADGLSLRNAGELLLVGCGSHRTGKPGQGWTAAEAFARQYLPEADIVRRWANQDCVTLDGMPYVGPYSPHTPGLYVITGFNKWGMTSAMAAALLMRDRLLGRDNPGAALLSPSRAMPLLPLMRSAGAAAAGLLTPTVPRCPHLGCALRWNPQEHSWDCPCHGSRFDSQGRLLDNPATGSLKHQPPKQNETP
ncbi:MAG: FAD-dependent oxidoreductase [Aristaeellaceae bacterium]